MNCPQCGQPNDINNAYCVGCGQVFTSGGASAAPPNIPDSQAFGSPTVAFPAANEYQSEPTVFGATPPNYQNPQPQFHQPQQFQPQPVQPQPVQPQSGFHSLPPNFDPNTAYQINQTPAPAKKSGALLWVGLGLFALTAIAVIGVGAWFFANRPVTPAEALPDHLGLFVQNGEKTAVDELRKSDYTNGFDARDKLSKEQSLQTVSNRPNIILYSDGKDIPVNDLKLIPLDSVKSDGAMKQIEFKATLIDGKPAMKRLYLAENLAKGRYAFALIDGNFDDGKHKFWGFQVTESDRNDNGTMVRDLMLPVKGKTPNAITEVAANKPPPTPKPTVAPPKDAGIAYTATNSIVLRSSPSLNGGKVAGLKKGQKLYVIAYSSNYDYWNGLEGNWANVQTESGQRGWVFSPLIR